MNSQYKNKSERIYRQNQIMIQRSSESERNSQSSKNSKNTVIRLSNEEVQSIKMERKSSHSSKNKQKNIVSQFYDVIVPETFKKQECLICQTQISKHQFVEFGSCNHKFCSMCINQYIRFKLNNFKQIFCPLEGCSCKLQKDHSLYQKMSSNQKQKYQKILLHFEILSNPNIRLCKTQKCKGKIQIKNSKEKIKQKLQCLQCKQEYCSLCFEYYHEDKCDSDMIRFLQKNKRFRQCKSCKRVVQKSEGCTHMTCLCGFYFCYQCGQQLIGNHQCKVPTHLNCIQLIRWDIEHKELFYQSNKLSFHSYLVCIQLSSDRPLILRILYSLLYIVSVYPLTIIFSFLLILLFFSFILCFAIIAFFVLPVIEMCGRPYFKITNAIMECCGCFTLAILIILFYPIFVIILILQALCQAFKSQDINNDLKELFSQIGIGLRNMIMMPCVLCLNPQNIDQSHHQNLEGSKTIN